VCTSTPSCENPTTLLECDGPNYEAFGCDPGSYCITDECVLAACSPGDIQCVSGDLETCDSTGQWGPETSCFDGPCVDGFGCPTCVPNSVVTCDTTELVTCNSNGTADSTEQCLYGCTVPSTCNQSSQDYQPTQDSGNHERGPHPAAFERLLQILESALPH
jgi:hypothetical protein